MWSLVRKLYDVKLKLSGNMALNWCHISVTYSIKASSLKKNHYYSLQINIPSIHFLPLVWGWVTRIFQASDLAATFSSSSKRTSKGAERITNPSRESWVFTRMVNSTERHPRGILIRCLIHIYWLLSTPRSSFWLSELLHPSLKLSPAEEPHFGHMYLQLRSLPRAHDHRWGSECRQFTSRSIFPSLMIQTLRYLNSVAMSSKPKDPPPTNRSDCFLAENHGLQIWRCWSSSQLLWTFAVGAGDHRLRRPTEPHHLRKAGMQFPVFLIFKINQKLTKGL